MKPSSQQILQFANDYRRQGYTKLQGVFSPEEASSWQQECERLQQLDLVNPNNKRTPFRSPEIPYPEKIDPVVDISPLFTSLTQDDRVLCVLRAIFDDEALLFKDKIIYKLPGMNGYGMHQDWAWGWQHLAPADDLLSVSFQIDGANAANGCIELFEDYHHELMTTPGEERGFHSEEVAELIDEKRGQKIETQPGDVLIFHSLTPHRSGGNVSDSSRRSLYLTFNAKRSGNLREEYYQHYINEMAGRKDRPDMVFV